MESNSRVSKSVRINAVGLALNARFNRSSLERCAALARASSLMSVTVDKSWRSPLTSSTSAEIRASKDSPLLRFRVTGMFSIRSLLWTRA